MTDRVKISVMGITHSQIQKGAYAVLLTEDGGPHRIPVVVGIAARLNPVKDMSTLIRGFAAAYAKCPRLRLVIAGDGEELEKLTALAKELKVEKQVTFAGWISGGMDRFYAALDINTLTSLSETFSYAVVEGTRFHQIGRAHV